MAEKLFGYMTSLKVSKSTIHTFDISAATPVYHLQPLPELESVESDHSFDIPTTAKGLVSCNKTYT
jgi:hypothetical protein